MNKKLFYPLPFPNEHEEPENDFLKAARLLDGINQLRVLMFKQQGIDFTPEEYAENAHGCSEKRFNYKLGFKKAPFDTDPVFDWIKSLKGFSFVYARSDNRVKHPYPHEIFLTHGDLDDLLVIVADKKLSIIRQVNSSPELVV